MVARWARWIDISHRGGGGRGVLALTDDEPLARNLAGEAFYGASHLVDLAG